MNARLRRVCGDVLVSAAVLGAVLTVLASIDVRVRDQIRAAAGSASPSTLADLGRRLRGLLSVMLDAASTQSIEHAPLMIFVVAATVLLLCMVRT